MVSFVPRIVTAVAVFAQVGVVIYKAVGIAVRMHANIAEVEFKAALG